MSNVTFDDTYTQQDFINDIRQNFTKRAGVYNNGHLGDQQRILHAQLTDLYPTKYPVLDIACGAGAFVAAQPNNGRGVTGVDITPAMLIEAAKLSPEAKFLEGRAEALPLPDAAFGSAYIASAIFYFTDIPGSLREAFRVLLPGGTLAYQAAREDSYHAYLGMQTALVDVLGEKKGLAIFRMPHTVTHSKEANERLMRSAGFVDIKTKVVPVKWALEDKDVDEWWSVLSDGYAFTTRIRQLSDQQIADVKKRFYAIFGEHRNKENTVDELVSCWYVCGTKPE